MRDTAFLAKGETAVITVKALRDLSLKKIFVEGIREGQVEVTGVSNYENLNEVCSHMKDNFTKIIQDVQITS